MSPLHLYTAARPRKPDWFEVAVLDVLRGGEQSGYSIREQVWPDHWWRTLLGFYCRMSKLEDAGLVAGENVGAMIDGVPVCQRWYRLTDAGRRPSACGAETAATVGRR